MNKISELLKNIFSIKNIEHKKIITILGIKFKFNKILSEKKFIEQINYVDTSIQNAIIKFNENIIIDNINNPLFFEVEQKIYNYFEEMKARKFYPIFRNRIILTNLDNMINTMQAKTNKEVVLVTDINFDNIYSQFKVVNINEIYQLKDKDCCIVLSCNQDFNAKKAIEELRKYNLKYISQFSAFPHARYFNIDNIAFDTLCEEAKNENWHFCPVDFENIFQAVKACCKLEGDFVEIGTYKGDSAQAMLNYMERKNIQKKTYFIDTFTGFDYNEALNSEDAQWQNTHGETSFDSVKTRLKQYKNAMVIQSNIISNDLPAEIDKIAFANVDVDMYDAVKVALYKLKDKVVQNGIIIAEDYGHTPSLIGAQKAVDEFLDENPDDFIPIYMASGQMFLIKK